MDQNFEFAVEFSFGFEFFTIVAESAEAARQLLWDNELSVEQKTDCSFIELTSILTA